MKNTLVGWLRGDRITIVSAPCSPDRHIVTSRVEYQATAAAARPTSAIPDDDDRGVNTMTENRYNMQAQYVPAVPATAKRAPVRIDGAHVQRIAESALQAPTNAAIDAAALTALETVSEKSTPVQRAVGVAIKSGVVVTVAMFATYALGVAGATGGQAALFFIVLVLGGVGALYRYDAEFSPIGGERYKARLFADIRHHEIDSNERVSLAKLEAYTATLEKVYGGQNDDN